MGRVCGAYTDAELRRPDTALWLFLLFILLWLGEIALFVYLLAFEGVYLWL